MTNNNLHSDEYEIILMNNYYDKEGTKKMWKYELWIRCSITVIN